MKSPLGKNVNPDRLDRDGALQQVKNYLVSLGPEHRAVQMALRLAGRRQGWRVAFDRESIQMRHGNRELILAKKEFVYVPVLMDWYAEFFFETMEPDRLDPHPVWDYSRPAHHSYQRSGLRFFFPALPEEDLMEAYTLWYSPKAGDTVWDVGAHAGVTTYYLSQLVGANGRVYAWEPDDFNYACLLRNIAEHNLTNVVPIRKALDGRTGFAQFEMDGTMTAGIRDYLFYSHSEAARQVETLSLSEASAEYGLPRYVKMDIEGAELAVVSGGFEFLKSHKIHWAIETHHLVAGTFTHAPIERIFQAAGYAVTSSNQFQIWHTWAAPPDFLPETRAVVAG